MRVSVVMAIYNDDPRFLEAAIRSVADQSFRDWELVISDDSTKSESAAVIERFKKELGDRLVYTHNEPRLGLAPSINQALSRSSGEFIARMDGDDICLPDRLERQVAYLESHPDVGILGGDIQIITEDSERLTVRHYRCGRREIERTSFIRNPLAQPTVMMRRSVLDAIGVYDASFKKAEDYELWLRALKRSVVVENLGKVVLLYRVPKVEARKRDLPNWKFGLKAKFRHFSWRHPFMSAAGIGLSIALMITPARLLDLLYRRDYRTPILF